MRKKAMEFISILMENRSEYSSLDAQSPSQDGLEWLGAFLGKSASLLMSVMEMNKIRWFDELKVSEPSQADIERVEQLQLSFRRIRESPTA
jgi:hypothetical protein